MRFIFQHTQYARTSQGTGFLHRTLRKLTSERDELIARLLPYFQRAVLPAGTTLWRRNDPSSFACIVEKGAWLVQGSAGWKPLRVWTKGAAD